MNFVVSGSTGLIGSALCAEAMNRGHRVRRLVRPHTLTSPNKAPLGTTIDWDPAEGAIATEPLEHTDIVVHLAGEPIAAGRWLPRKKRRILDSRVEGTTVLAKALTKLLHPPKLLLCASATGFYGDRGDQTLDEEVESGSGFLPEVCRRWEASAQPAIDHGIPTAFLRFGMVLSPDGGALGKILPIFRLGLGGRIGDGEQYWSWIAIDDAVNAVLYLADRADQTAGPYNLVAPTPLTNAEFTEALGKRLHRPTMLPVPEAWLDLLAGEMGEHLLLASQRIVPRRLTEAGYRFAHPTLAEALKALI